jgi:hypothetical protein
MDEGLLSDFGQSEVQLRWNLERSIFAYDQMTAAGDTEPRRRLKMLDGILSTSLKLAKALTKRAEYEQDHTSQGGSDSDIRVCEVTQMLTLMNAFIAR